MNAAKDIYGIRCPPAEPSRRFSLQLFHDAGDRNRMTSFLNTGRKVWLAADHVELWVAEGGSSPEELTIGSRLSTA
jgi:hypothetical protein